MNDRARAISILQQARDILTERLTEQILQSRDAILEDAVGLSYTSEIDALHEQLGQRLNNVNVLLNNLPPIEDAPPPRPEDIAPPVTTPALGYEPYRSTIAPAVESVGSSDTAALRTPTAGDTAVYEVAAVEPVAEPTIISFQSFAERILANDVEGAGFVLAGLFGVSVERGRQCALRFQEQLVDRPQFLQRAMGLRAELADGSVNGSLILLWECFGLQGIESLAALQSLRARLGAGNST